MLTPVELQLFPSCLEALSWSPDGELAVAAGEHVQILTPKSGRAGTNAQPKDAWGTTRIRVNTFTNAEWASIAPQNRDDFSLGAEQSTSTVIGLAWSPAGLARFRRSVLAVLTSNLILSLWEPIGSKAIWTRVAIVNHALHPNPEKPSILTGGELRKANIRSFNWCSPIKIPSQPEGPDHQPEIESRWGIYLMSIANDTNDVILLQIKRITGAPSATRSYCTEKLTSHRLEANNVTPQMHPESILYKTLQLKSRILSISTGPWTRSNPATQDGVYSTSALLAAVHGKQLCFLKATVAVHRSINEVDNTTQYKVKAGVEDHPLKPSSPKWEQYQIDGPLRWVSTNTSPRIALVAGTVDGFLTISMSHSMYQGNDKKSDRFECWPTAISSFPCEDGEPRSDWEPITAMATFNDEQNESCVLHLGTAAALSATTILEGPEASGSLELPHWSRLIMNIREQFDLARDLGGNVGARIWGLASYRGVMAVLVTCHPTHMIQYKVASDERAVVGFSVEGSDQTPDFDSLFSPSKTEKEHTEETGKEKAIAFLLSQCDKGDEVSEEDQRLVYSAACCSILGESPPSSTTQVGKALEWLSIKSGADLSEELSKCSNGPSMISAKSSDQLASPGSHLFEKCDICDAAIPWVSSTEAQCANGHLFVRCALTFQAIQEPGLSKYCSGCRREFIDEELVSRLREAPPGPVFTDITRAFDTCLYCNAKFSCTYLAQ